MTIQKFKTQTIISWELIYFSFEQCKILNKRRLSAKNSPLHFQIKQLKRDRNSKNQLAEVRTEENLEEVEETVRRIKIFVISNEACVLIWILHEYLEINKSNHDFWTEKKRNLRRKLGSFSWRSKLFFFQNYYNKTRFNALKRYQCPKIAKTLASAEKLMETIFWDNADILSIEYFANVDVVDKKKQLKILKLL